MKLRLYNRHILELCIQKLCFLPSMLKGKRLKNIHMEVRFNNNPFKKVPIHKLCKYTDICTFNTYIYMSFIVHFGNGFYRIEAFSTLTHSHVLKYARILTFHLVLMCVRDCVCVCRCASAHKSFRQSLNIGFGDSASTASFAQTKCLQFAIMGCHPRIVSIFDWVHRIIIHHLKCALRASTIYRT